MAETNLSCSSAHEAHLPTFGLPETNKFDSPHLQAFAANEHMLADTLLAKTPNQPSNAALDAMSNELSMSAVLDIAHKHRALPTMGLAFVYGWAVAGDRVSTARSFAASFNSSGEGRLPTHLRAAYGTGYGLSMGLQMGAQWGVDKMFFDGQKAGAGSLVADLLVTPALMLFDEKLGPVRKPLFMLASHVAGRIWDRTHDGQHKTN